MVQDEFSRPRFCVASAFWVSRVSVSVEQRQGLDLDMDMDMDLDLDLCLCGTDTVSVWDTHSVSVWDTHSPGGGWGGAGGFRGQLQPHTGASQSPTHTSKIAIPQLRWDKLVV